MLHMRTVLVHTKIDYRFKLSGKGLMTHLFAFVGLERILSRKPPATNTGELWRQMHFTFQVTRHTAFCHLATAWTTITHTAIPCNDRQYVIHCDSRYIRIG